MTLTTAAERAALRANDTDRHPLHPLARAHAYTRGSLVLSSTACYHCDERHRHRLSCPWNTESVSA